MNQICFPADLATTISSDTDGFALTFVEDTDYEFVGGGNAVNGF